MKDISNKVKFKMRIIRYEKKYYILIKGAIFQAGIIITNHPFLDFSPI